MSHWASQQELNYVLIAVCISIYQIESGPFLILMSVCVCVFSCGKPSIVDRQDSSSPWNSHTSSYFYVDTSFFIFVAFLILSDFYITLVSFSDFLPIGSMVLLYMITWIPSIYPSHVSIFLPAPWIRHGLWLAAFTRSRRSRRDARRVMEKPVTRRSPKPRAAKTETTWSGAEAQDHPKDRGNHSCHSL